MRENRALHTGISLILLLILTFWLGCSSDKQDRQPTAAPVQVSAENAGLVIYTPELPATVQQLLDAFKQQIPAGVAQVTVPQQQLRDDFLTAAAQGHADVLLTDQLVDVLQLQRTHELDVIQNQILDDFVSEKNKSPGFNWTLIGGEVYTIAGLVDRVQPTDLRQYSNLADDKFNGKVLLPSSKDMELFLAEMITIEGREAATQWVEGVAANRAQPLYEDADQLIRSLANGDGAVALMPAVRQMQFQYGGDAEKAAIGNRIGMNLPHHARGHAYINGLAIAISNRSNHKSNARKLVDYLLNKDAQDQLTNYSHYDPVYIYSLPGDYLGQLGGYQSPIEDWFAVEDQLPAARELLKQLQ